MAIALAMPASNEWTILKIQHFFSAIKQFDKMPWRVEHRGDVGGTTQLCIGKTLYAYFLFDENTNSTDEMINIVICISNQVSKKDVPNL